MNKLKKMKERLMDLINTDFTDKNIYITLTYEPDNLPKSKEEAHRDVINYLRRINCIRKKYGLPPAKYCIMSNFKDQEESHKSIRVHHQLLISRTDGYLLKKLWTKGLSIIVEVDREVLAPYLIKYFGENLIIRSKNTGLNHESN